MDITFLIHGHHPMYNPRVGGQSSKLRTRAGIWLSLSERAAGDDDVGQVVLRSTIAFLHGNDKIPSEGRTPSVAMAPMRKRLNLRAGAWGEEKSLWVMFSGWAQGRLYSSHTSPLHWPQVSGSASQTLEEIPGSTSYLTTHTKCVAQSQDGVGDVHISKSWCSFISTLLLNENQIYD